MADKTETAELEIAVRRFGEAWAKGDLKTLEALLSPTYTHTDVFGALNNRAAWLAYAAGRAGRSTQISFRDVEMRRIGDTAIVTGINDVAGGGARNSGDQRPLALRFTQVWMLRDGRWLREAFQGTPIGTERGS
jgi:ketosteroid isomerase-like protein